MKPAKTVTRMFALAPMLVAYLTLVAAERQQPARDTAVPAAVGTASVSGVVVTDDTAARPLRLAGVTLTVADTAGPSGARSRVATTDASGRFSFTELPAGRYSLTVSKPVYVTNYYGSRRPGVAPGTPIALAADQKVTLTIKMMRGAVIAGTVQGLNAQLAPAIRMSLMQARMVNGERTFATVGGPSLDSLDESGRYRVYGIAPGEYYLAVSSLIPLGISGGETRQITPAELEWALRQFQATPSSAGGFVAVSTPKPPPPGPSMGFAPIYYPGTTDPAAATPLTLGPGEERTGIDFPMSLVPTAKVEGIVVGPDGQPPQTVQVNMISSSASGLGSASVFIRPTPDGKFSTVGLQPGTYVIVARGAARGGPGENPAPAPGRGRSGSVTLPLWASEEITINGDDISGVVLTLQPGLTVSGRVVFETTTTPAPADLSSINVGLTAVAGRSGISLGVPTVGASTDGSFEITGVVPGRFRFTATPPSPAGASVWTLKSAVVAGRDVLDLPFEVVAGANVNGAVITFIDKVSELSGSLIDPGGRPAPDHYIVAFAVDRAMWTMNSRRVKQVRPGTNGTYRFAGLPPGEYYVCALTDIETGQLNDSTFLEQLISASIKISLSEGEKKTQDLRIGGD